ncbi:MAG: ABC transporter substrate-binding protein [Microthrixaceae bacterium]
MTPRHPTERSTHASRARRVLAAAVVGILLAATVSCTPDDARYGTFTAKVEPADCGLAEFARAPKPVTITMWHVLARSSEEWLQRVTQRFNESQGDVRVRLLQQPGYPDEFTKYKAGLTSGDLPDIATLEETVVQQMIDSQGSVPVQACFDADHYDTSPFVPRALEYYKAGGVQRAMPWTVSNPILFYDRDAFRKAGLDPDHPPRTLDEVRRASQAIVRSKAAKHGISLKIAPYLYEVLLAKSGGELVDHGNGRKARADATNLTSPTSRSIWRWWREMVRSGLAVDTGADPNSFDHLLAIANHNAAMTFEASGAIGPINAVLSSGVFGEIHLATAPLPSLRGGGGVPVGDGALWLLRHSSKVKRAAAWQFVKFLSTAEMSASLAADGGYVPVRKDAVTQPLLAEKWAAEPIYRTAYDQLLSGPLDTATVGSLIGDYRAVRDNVRDGMIRMLRQGVSAARATSDAKAEADIALQEYNDRVGG